MEEIKKHPDVGEFHRGVSKSFRQNVPSGGITNAFQDTGHPTIADCLAASGQTMP